MHCECHAFHIGVLSAGRLEIHTHLPVPRIPSTCFGWPPEAFLNFFLNPSTLSNSHYQHILSTGFRHGTTGAQWEAARTTKQQAARESNKLDRFIAHLADPGDRPAMSGPEVAGQACKGECKGTNHFALRCEQQPKLCGRCCSKSAQGPCPWHAHHTASLALAHAVRRP